LKQCLSAYDYMNMNIENAENIVSLTMHPREEKLCYIQTVTVV